MGLPSETRHHAELRRRLFEDAALIHNRVSAPNLTVPALSAESWIIKKGENYFASTWSSRRRELCAQHSPKVWLRGESARLKVNLKCFDSWDSTRVSLSKINRDEYGSGKNFPIEHSSIKACKQLRKRFNVMERKFLVMCMKANWVDSASNPNLLRRFTCSAWVLSAERQQKIQYLRCACSPRSLEVSGGRSAYLKRNQWAI